MPPSDTAPPMIEQPVFLHEKLDVYRRALGFVGRLDGLFAAVDAPVAVADHLARAGESILENLVNGNASWSDDERRHYFAIANGSALECAACLDVGHAKDLLSADALQQQKMELRRIVQMLVGLMRTTEDGVRDGVSEWNAERARGVPPVFHHEELDVYRLGLSLVRWGHLLSYERALAKKRATVLDALTTSIVLNIAEGNGRVGHSGQRQFADIAHRSVLRVAVQIDLMTSRGEIPVEQSIEGKHALGRMAKMLLALRGTARRKYPQ